jgi:hypothetical protein
MFAGAANYEFETVMVTGKAHPMKKEVVPEIPPHAQDHMKP